MSARRPPHHGLPVTRSRLVSDLRALGVREGAVLMVHTRMSAIGWVVGGTETVVRALLETVGPTGTVMAYAGWEDNPYDLESWPDEWRRAYLEELPAFDPEISESAHEHGRVPERIRTWPGARRSAHPEAGIVAVGARAEWITHRHPSDDGYGAGSPLARLVEARGQVLMLGAPLETITLLHHAESLADVPGKRRVTYRMPVLEDGHRVWQIFTDIDTSDAGPLPYAEVVGDEDEFEVIGREALGAGCGVTGRVGEAVSHLFEADALLTFAVGWLEARFGERDRYDA
jgi:aminoglycoside 3-N-acetyltransferase